MRSKQGGLCIGLLFLAHPSYIPSPFQNSFLNPNCVPYPPFSSGYPNGTVVPIIDVGIEYLSGTVVPIIEVCIEYPSMFISIADVVMESMGRSVPESVEWTGMMLLAEFLST